jgi:hypothetical protein
MNRNRSLFAISALLAAVILGVSGCGGGSNAPIISVAISPMMPQTVPVNGIVNFTAQVNGTANQAVNWQVNGVTGGNASTTGSISTSGMFTAPAAVPAANNGQVTVTAVSQQDNKTTSNAVTVTIISGSGFVITPTNQQVLAGQPSPQPFSVMLNGAPDANAAWTVTAATGANAGSITPSGSTATYTAPRFPPPGATVTITAKDGANSATAMATIGYSVASLNGTYSFAYTGDDGSGFLVVAGQIGFDGQGNTTGGVEDENSLGAGASPRIQLGGQASAYTVTPDGRGQVSLSSGETLDFALSNQDSAGRGHGLIIRFNGPNDPNGAATGSGTIDQQDTTAALNGTYAFNVSGLDPFLAPLGIAGKFPTGTLSILSPTIQDLNDGGTVTKADGTLTGFFSPDGTIAGRGTITFQSSAYSVGNTPITPNGRILFAYYVVDSAHVNLVGIDAQTNPAVFTFPFLAGTMVSAPASGNNAFTNSILTSGNWAFTAGGSSSSGAFASGGVFTSNGSGSLSGGVYDINNNGSTRLGLSVMSSSTYAVDATTGRIDLTFNNSGGTTQFALYTTSLNPPTALVLQIAGNPVASGVAFLQTSNGAGGPAAAVGSFAINITGVGQVGNIGTAEQDAVGQINLTSTSATGTLDVNNFGATGNTNLLPANVILSSSTVSASNNLGRGTAVLNVKFPTGTTAYNLIYYIVNSNTVLLVDTDRTRIALGTILRQF